jgi:hypothetical protein
MRRVASHSRAIVPVLVILLVGLALIYVVTNVSISASKGGHDYGKNGWTFDTLGGAVSDIAITQGIQQAVFLTTFDNCLVYDYNPTPTTYAIVIYNLSSHVQSVPITINTPNGDGPISMLAEGSTLYFGFGSYAGNIADGAIYSTTNLENYTLLYTWSSGFQPEALGYYTQTGTLLVSGDGGPNTGIVYEFSSGVPIEIESDSDTGDATLLAMFNSTMIVTAGTFPQTPIFSNNLVTWTSNDTDDQIGNYVAPYVMPWSWTSELVYGRLWMPVARFTAEYPDESGLASFGGGTGNTSYNSYISKTDSYYSIADGLVGGTEGLTLGSETNFPGRAIIQQFSSTGQIGSTVFEYGVGGHWAVASMAFDPTTNHVYGALLGQSQKEIILIEGTTLTT